MNTENNKIIAEFMGYEIQKDPTERFFGRYKQPLGAWTKEIDLAFHHDWNWLMEVVEKIEGLDRNNENDQESHFLLTFIHHWLIRPHKESTKIQAVYNTCVKYIKLYNEQKN